MKKTEEQLENTDVFRTGADLVIEAGAGCGKTSQLVMLGQTPDAGRGVMIAFNKAVAVEAQSKFPSNVSCSTAHSLAFRAIVNRPCVQRLGGPPVQAKSLAEDFLGIRSWFNDVPQGRKAISSWKIASLAVQAVRRFCYSDDDEVQPWHVPWVEGITGEHEKSLRKQVLPFAREIWDDLQKGQGFARFEHDHYMKMWALEDPRIDADFLLVDESQDTNGVLAGVIRKQDHLQRVLVGDSQQRLFGWRGSVDIMHEFEDAEVRYLSQSFRFGQAVAEEANLWLSYLEAPLRLRGLPTISSRLEALEQPDAILCRTNADVIAQAMAAQQRDKKVAVVGGTQDISSFAAAVDDLRSNGKTRHPELSAFKTWFDVQSYVRDEQPGGNFATAVRLIETYGTATVQEVAARCVDPRDADLVVSTVHKVKGLEWPRVQIDARLVPEQSDGQTADGSKDELRVAYVAVTRAKEVLDATAVEGYHGRRRARREAVAAPSA
jgi:superfamily I DNA/RNA helicase